MEFPDLYELPTGHPPSPDGEKLTIFKCGFGTLPDDISLRAAGWLMNEEFTIGKVSKDVIELLKEAYNTGIFHDGFSEIQNCKLCNKTKYRIHSQGKRINLTGHGHYLVQHGNIVYMAPSLLLHYIIKHKYKPPDEFIEAVLHGKFLKEEDLIITWQDT